MDGLQVQWLLSDLVDMAAVLQHRIRAALVEPNNLD